MDEVMNMLGMLGEGPELGAAGGGDVERMQKGSMEE